MTNTASFRFKELNMSIPRKEVDSMKTEILKNEPVKMVPISHKPKLTFDPFLHEMKELTDKITKRAFEFFEKRGYQEGHEMCDWLLAERDIMQPMPIELTDKGDEMILSANVPGFESKDLEINVEGSRVTIRGFKETKKEKKDDGKVLYSEKHSAHVFRSIDLPTAVVMDKVEAKLANGVLEMKFPKVAKPARIEVKAS
jgi:HSP20 family protein